MSDLDQEFVCEQFVSRRREEVFDFFSRAENLERITPPWLNFKILTESSPEMGSGNLIVYALRIRGLPVRWRTLISEWDPPHRFVDVQLNGPYARWEHTHEFEEVSEGTRMIDRVVYRLPFGNLGLGLAGGMVKRDVERIFQYRREKIRELLP